MTINQMRYFVTVCEFMSFTKAAEALFITQPAISKHIAALEKELDTRLFDRSSKAALRITPAGEHYLAAFRESLAAIDSAALRARFAGEQKALRYRVGVVENWLLWDLLDFCRQDFSQSFPDVQLDFLFLSHRELNIGRADGVLDFILTISTALQDVPGYSAEQLTKIRSVLLLSAAHPLAKKPDLAPADLRALPYYTLPVSEMPFVRNPDPYIASELGIPRWTELPNLSTIAMYVLSGQGYTAFDAWSAEVQNPLFHPFTLESSLLPVAASWREGRHQEIGAHLFALMQSRFPSIS